MRDRGFSIALACLVFFGVLVPFLTFSSFLIFEYDRASAGFIFSPITYDDISLIGTMPELTILARLFFYSVAVALSSLVMTIFVLLPFLIARRENSLSAISLALLISFFLPLILKANSFYQIFGSGLQSIIFFAITYFVLFVAPFSVMWQGLSGDARSAFDEYYSIGSRLRYHATTAIPALVIGALVCWAITFFSGKEVYFLTSKVHSLGEQLAGMQVGRDRELGALSVMLLIISFVVSLCGARAAVTIWTSRD